MSEDDADGPWYFENRQRTVEFDENRIRAFLAR